MTATYDKRFMGLAKLMTNNLEVVELTIASLQGYNDERALAARKKLREIRANSVIDSGEIGDETTEMDLLVNCFHNVRTILRHEGFYKAGDEPAYAIESEKIVHIE